MCLSGSCRSGSLWDTFKVRHFFILPGRCVHVVPRQAWYTQNLQISIPVTVVAGLFIVMLIACCFKGTGNVKSLRSRPMLTVFQRYVGAPNETSRGGCLQNPGWLARARNGSQAGRERTTVYLEVMTLRRGKRRKQDLVWLGSAQIDLPAITMCLYSTARQFLIPRRRGLVITITDLEVVVVAADKVGWTTPPTMDLYINLIIKYSVLSADCSACASIRSCILFIRFLPLNMHVRCGRAPLAESN